MYTLLSKAFYSKHFYLKSSFILLTVLLMNGCGFHLKHIDGLADKYPQIYLQSNNQNSDLARFIKIRLLGAGVQISPSPSDDIATLIIASERQSARTISLTVRAVNAEKELSYNLSYSIQSPGYQANSFSVNLYRDFLDNPAQALAKSREAELLTQEFRSIAADHIMTNLLGLKNSSRNKIDNNESDELQ